eukprot:2471778-Amphidinium_carterae.1
MSTACANLGRARSFPSAPFLSQRNDDGLTPRCSGAQKQGSTLRHLNGVQVQTTKLLGSGWRLYKELP